MDKHKKAERAVNDIFKNSTQDQDQTDRILDGLASWEELEPEEKLELFVKASSSLLDDFYANLYVIVQDAVKKLVLTVQIATVSVGAVILYLFLK